MKPCKVALLFGGRSAEHDVSVMSARSVYDAIDRERYDLTLIAIGRDGRWWLQEHRNEFPSAVMAAGAEISFLPGGGGKVFVHEAGERGSRTDHFDVVLPILHGPYGEDGTLQGLLELAQVPFVGAGVLASAVCMDKQIAKSILRDAGLPVARSLAWTTKDWTINGQDSFRVAQDALGSSVLFVKPASLGSSVGVSKVTSAAEFDAALELAFRHDRKVLVEEYVEAREIECGVLEDANESGKLFATWPGEIVPELNRHGFYSYEAKYLDEAGAELKTRAALDEEMAERVRELSCEAFRALGCEAMARVDFFLRPNGELLINEINTIPGFTPISMFPKMMAASGIPYDVLIHTLLEHALKRAERQRSA